MKSKKIEFWAVLMSMLLIMTLIPFTAFAEDGEGTVPEPVSIYYAAALKGYPGGYVSVDQQYVEFSSVQVTYSDNNIKHFKYGTHKYADGSEETGYFLEGADPEDPLSFISIPVIDATAPLKQGWNTFKVTAAVPYVNADGDLSYKVVEHKDDAGQDYRLWVDMDIPKKIEFQPASGFVVNGAIGPYCIEESDFYGEGNKFVVTYEYKNEDLSPATYDRTYEYIKGVDDNGETVEGFFWGGVIDDDGRLDLPYEGFYCDLKKGTNNVECIWECFVEWQDEPYELPFNVQVKAEKYSLYYEWRVYGYTGKVIKPKFVVRRMYDDKVVPSSQYTYKVPKNKKMGYYDVQLKFKDAYKNLYTEPVIEASYGIGPTAPKLTKVKGGKKKLTVSWKKFSKKQLKTVDTMYIEVSTDKHFYNNYKRYTVSGKALKKGSKTLGKLKSKKKYFVRAYTVKKKVKQGKYTFSMMSDDSNTLKGKTK